MVVGVENVDFGGVNNNALHVLKSAEDVHKIFMAELVAGRSATHSHLENWKEIEVTLNEIDGYIASEVLGYTFACTRALHQHSKLLAVSHGWKYLGTLHIEPRYLMVVLVIDLIKLDSYQTLHISYELLEGGCLSRPETFTAAATLTLFVHALAVC